MNNKDPGKEIKPVSPLILLLAIGIIAGCVILAVFLIAGRFNNLKNNWRKTIGKQEVRTEAKRKVTTEASTETTTEAATASRSAATDMTELSTENTGQEETTQHQVDKNSLSDSLDDYTFLLDGVIYQLPCDFSEFTRNGWSVSPYSDKKDTDLVAEGEEVFFSFRKDSLRFVAMACNSDKQKKALKDCKIVGVSITSVDSRDFKMAKEITLMSTSDDILKAYGEPDYSHDYKEYISFSYYTEHNSFKSSTTFTVYKLPEKTKYNSVFLRRIIE